MDKLVTIPVTGVWKDQVERINNNIDIIQEDLLGIERGESLFKGFFLSLLDLNKATNKYPYPPEGSYAYVNSNGSFPATLYTYSANTRSWIQGDLVDTPEDFELRILLGSEEIQDIKSILLD